MNTTKQQDEDHQDYETGLKALKRFEVNPVTHSIDDVIKELQESL